jgi:GT2 family glycosyltransferase
VRQTDADKGSVDVSIIVPVQDDLDQAWRCFVSLSRLPEQPQHEIVIVDDAAENLGDLLERLGGDVAVVRCESRVGFARTANLGAARASGEVLVFLRGTPEVGPRWLDPLVAAVGRDGVAAAVSDQVGQASAHRVTSPAFAVTRESFTAAGGVPPVGDEVALGALAAELAGAGQIVVASGSVVLGAERAPVSARLAPGSASELTVVVPTLDATSARMRRCLTAIAMTTDVPHEIVIVDNGSPPQGYTAPVNAGIRAARGRYVVIMNDDVEPLPGWWPPLQEGLDAGAPVVFPATQGGAKRSDFAAWCFALTRDCVDRFSVSPGEFFDPRFTVWFQDTDLLVRLRSAGCPPRLVAGSNIRHGLSETVDSADPILARWIQEQVAADEKRFLEKHPGARLTPMALSSSGG